jgi:hypothetical protein
MPAERVWRNILKSDPSVDLVHFTILRPPESRTAPIRELVADRLPDPRAVRSQARRVRLAIIFDRYSRRG